MNENSFVVPEAAGTLFETQSVPQPGSCNVAAGTQSPEKSLEFIGKSTFAPNASWTLGGAFLYDNALKHFVRYANSFVKSMHVNCISGAPVCLWTLDWFASRPLSAPLPIVNTIKEHLSHRVAFQFDFDNPFLTEEDCADSVGNIFLSVMTTMPGGNVFVCVASDVLADYIRAKFPQLKLIAGENRAVVQNARGNVDYYKKALEKFERVIVHPLDATDAPFLKKLINKEGVPAERLEVSVNDTCLRGCPLRVEHLRALAEKRKFPYDGERLKNLKSILAQAHCDDVTPDGPKTLGECAAVLTRDEVRALAELGIVHFRIQAKKLRNELTYIWQLGEWLVSDDPALWHKKAAFINGAAVDLVCPESRVKSGLNPFVKRKYE